MSAATHPNLAPEPAWKSAHEFYLNGQYARAKLLLEPLMLTYPDDHRVRSLHGMVYLHFGEPLKAAENLQHDPNWQALVLALTGDYNGAKRLADHLRNDTLADEQLTLMTRAALAIHENSPNIAQQWLTDAWSIDQRDEAHANRTELLDTERHAVMLYLSFLASTADQARRYVFLSGHTHPRTNLLARTQRLCEICIALDVSNPETQAELAVQMNRAVTTGDHFNLMLFGPTAIEELGKTQDIRGIETFRPLLPDISTVNLAHGIALALSYQSPGDLLKDPLDSPNLEIRRAAYREATEPVADRSGTGEKVVAPRGLNATDRNRVNGIRERRASNDPTKQRSHVLNLSLIGPTRSLKNGRRIVKLPERAIRMLAHLVISNRAEQRAHSSDDLIPALLGEPLSEDSNERRKQKLAISKLIWHIRENLGKDTVITGNDRYQLNLTQPLVFDTDAAERAIAGRDIHNAAMLLANGVLPDEPEGTTLYAWKERLYRTFFLTVEEHLSKPITGREKHNVSLVLAPFLDWPYNDPMIEELAGHCLELLRQTVPAEHC